MFSIGLTNPNWFSRRQKCHPLKNIFDALFVSEEYKHFEIRLFLTN